MSQTMVMEGPAVTTHHTDGFETLPNNFLINTIPVALLAVSSYGTLFWHSSNTAVPMNL